MNTRSRSELLTAEEQVTSIVRTLADYAEMTKPRIVGLVGIATLGGFYLGSVGPIDIPLLCHALIGTVLLGCGANALNMYLERHSDRLMRRTENRPSFPARTMPPRSLGNTGIPPRCADESILRSLALPHPSSTRIVHDQM